MEYEKRPCEVCGREYVPKRKNQRCCLSEYCRKEMRKINNREYMRKKRGAVSEWARAYSIPTKDAYRRRRAPKPDNIVAEGYAERQVSATLAMVEKIKVDL